jgi:hypothetical protein
MLRRASRRFLDLKQDWSGRIADLGYRSTARVPNSRARVLTEPEDPTKNVVTDVGEVTGKINENPLLRLSPPKENTTRSDR